MSIYKRLDELGIVVAVPSAPIAAYVPFVRTGRLVFVSGQLPRIDGAILHPGRVGQDVSLEQAQEAARVAAISVLAVLNAAAGDLNLVTRIVRLNGYVASEPRFTDQSKVIDGASNLFLQVFGDDGRHSRVAVGVAALPLNAPVEIDLVAELKE